MSRIFNRYTKSNDLWEKGKKLILNGVQTLSKSPLHIALGASPIYVDRAKGAYFWDVDGNRYIDYPLALGPVVLGHAFDEVDFAVKEQISKGVLYSLSSELEITLAELLCEVIPSAEKVRILKTGSDAVSAAVRIARAYTGKENIAACGYHGWHDWTAIRTSRSGGIPSFSEGLIYEFKYNDIGSLQNIFDKNPDKIAAVVLEPVGMYAPKDNFLDKVTSLTRTNGALLVFDEIITGFRLALGGAQSYFSVLPDLSAFGKAMANGYPISAVVGRKEIMNDVEERVFISSTYGGDLLSITAAIKTIQILRERKVNDQILYFGQQLKNGLNDTIEKYEINAECVGMPHKTFLVFNPVANISSKAIETLFRQECFARGVFLGYGHFICYSHTEEDIRQSIAVASEVFGIIKNSLIKGDIHSRLKGEIATDVFKRY